ncbi:Ankyrin repeat family protein [Trifolium repens]|nr:Ankyrin repeat family protein [Trifolium repens]
MSPPRPEKKIFFAAPSQDEEDISKNIRNNDKELEIEPSEVTGIILKCCEFEDQINLISEAYHLAYGGPKNLFYDSSNLAKIETPMKNTVLHIAALHGNNDIVTLIVEYAPKLLFKLNKNNDSVLHVAARGGHISTVKKLLESYANFERHDIATAWLEYTRYVVDNLEDYDGELNMEDLLNFVKKENIQGNTMLHEAMLCGEKKSINIVNHAKKSVLYIAVENGDKDAVKLILEKSPKNDAKPKGLSPVVASIMKHNQEILNIILKNKPSWIHSRDKHERLPLHYAASIGYLEGVDLLLKKCICCTIQRDKYGYFPIHLASYGGHIKVVEKLLEYCPDPTEMLDTTHERNILHIASNFGKYEVVHYILQSQIREHYKMINQKDNEGNTPLHLAARSCHPTTVYYLVNQSKERVDLDLVNKNNETALDIVSALYELDKSSLRQHLTWTALKSAGANHSPRKVSLKKTEQDKDKKQDNLEEQNKTTETKQSNENSTKTEQKQSSDKEKEKVSERYKDRIENLTIVSTLIITASVAACLAVPGEADGKAHNLNHAMFHVFIIFITISLFSAISATIILFWATLGLTELLTFSLKIVMPLLGIALISLSLAFMAGLYTVISELTWLANVFLFITVIFVVVVIFLYILLFLPSSSTNKPLRYISHYPYLFLASRTESKIDQGVTWG